MTNYLATPFHGDKYDENPAEFLDWFLQYMDLADNDTKARNFIYYLQADSLADEWFEELEEEEKGSWEVIEVLFRKKWLKEEEISIKKTVTLEYKPDKPPTTTTHLINRTETALQPTPASENRNNKSLPTQQFPALFENRKNSKIHPISENPPNIRKSCRLGDLFMVKFANHHIAKCDIWQCDDSVTTLG